MDYDMHAADPTHTKHCTVYRVFIVQAVYTFRYNVWPIVLSLYVVFIINTQHADGG